MNKYIVTGYVGNQHDGSDVNIEIEAETYEQACVKALEHLGLTLRGPL